MALVRRVGVHSRDGLSAPCRVRNCREALSTVSVDFTVIYSIGYVVPSIGCEVASQLWSSAVLRNQQLVVGFYDELCAQHVVSEPVTDPGGC